MPPLCLGTVSTDPSLGHWGLPDTGAGPGASFPPNSLERLGRGLHKSKYRLPLNVNFRKEWLPSHVEVYPTLYLKFTLGPQFSLAPTGGGGGCDHPMSGSRNQGRRTWPPIWAPRLTPLGWPPWMSAPVHPSELERGVPSAQPQRAQTGLLAPLSPHSGSCGWCSWGRSFQELKNPGWGDTQQEAHLPILVAASQGSGLQASEEPGGRAVTLPYVPGQGDLGRQCLPFTPG